jgi:hypothetical protein
MRIIDLTRLSIFALFLAICTITFQQNHFSKSSKMIPKSNPAQCSQEAKICPDGSVVDRVPPNCDFAPCPTIQPSSHPTANWKTYQNTQNKYTLNYPSNWTIQETESEVDLLEPNSSYSLIISLLKNIPDTDKFISDLKNDPKYLIENKNPIKIGNYETVHQILKSPPGYNSPYTQDQLYALYRNTIIEAVFLSDNSARTKTITQILSTFHFLEK